MEEPVEYNAGKKEERIFITTRYKHEEFNMTFTGMCKEYTRNEAIEKMRKGFVSKYRGYFYCEPKHPNISDCLEAALDALLSEVE